MRPVLEVQAVTKAYGPKTVVKSVSFSVESGIIFGFIGPNGAGKSTVIKMITGLASIDSGDIFIYGHSIKRNFEHAISNVGAIIEAPDLYKHMSGYDNLKFFASLYKKDISKRKILDTAKLVGLEHRIFDKVGKYSLGMKQRLGIAQAILHDPKLIILDEPTNGLDAQGIVEMRTFLKQYAHEKRAAIVISSHILSELENLCDIFAIINNGTIVEYKTRDELMDINAPNYTIKVSYPNFAGKLIKQSFSIDVKLLGNQVLLNMDESLVPQVFKLLIKNGIDIFGSDKITKSLEEVFMDIIKSKNSGTSVL